ncbi:hypothetical protein [Celeribacter sp. PS-C1]|uniref:hypothetical protein n=1 Tax=Celeribacter sp. PS-C1 TaxID=2820813 RepID=UPI001CA49133|nr:hypothetical protein [Celeribacter sp. PS-C1]MBW6416148.1 hypothetical protein [Celeribacter sp. PS-C1]
MRTLFSTTALTALCLMGTPALADITPEEAWEAYRGQMAQMGMEPTAEVTREGDTLVVRNMVYGLEMDLGETSVTTTTTAPEIRFQEQNGGTVAVRFVEPLNSISVTPVGPGFDGAAETDMIETRSTMTIDGITMVSGTPESLMFTLENNAVTSKSEAVVIDDMVIQPGLSVAMIGIGGTYTIVEGEDGLSSEMDLNANTLTYDFDPMDTETGDKVEMGFAANDMKMTGSFTLPEGENVDFMQTLLGDSSMDVTIEMAGSTYSMAIVSETPGGGMTIDATTGSTTLDMTLNDGAVGYDSKAADLNVIAAGAQIPGGQANVSLQQYNAALLFPLAASEEMQPFELRLGLEGLVLPEIAWMIADPTGQLPHDPASLRIALDGTLENGIDLFDVAALTAMEESGAKMPFKVETLNIPEIFLDLAGATIRGEGAGHFLDQEPAVPGGLPPFAGKLSLNMVGVTDLITKLSSAGIMPPEQAMSAQMMLGLFARPGETAGELVSEIEMTEDGQIIANGQPLPF